MPKTINSARIQAIKDEVQGYSRVQIAQHGQRIIETLLDVVQDVCLSLEKRAAPPAKKVTKKKAAAR